jgi:hypothetical protein
MRASYDPAHRETTWILDSKEVDALLAFAGNFIRPRTHFVWFDLRGAFVATTNSHVACFAELGKIDDSPTNPRGPAILPVFTMRAARRLAEDDNITVIVHDDSDEIIVQIGAFRARVKHDSADDIVANVNLSAVRSAQQPGDVGVSAVSCNASYLALVAELTGEHAELHMPTARDRAIVMTRPDPDRGIVWRALIMPVVL